MARLVPAIHDLNTAISKQFVDARHKAGMTDGAAGPEPSSRLPEQPLDHVAEGRRQAAGGDER